MPYDDPRWMGGIGMIGTKADYHAVMHAMMAQACRCGVIHCLSLSIHLRRDVLHCGRPIT